jgi:hypothetical protein
MTVNVDPEGVNYNVTEHAQKTVSVYEWNERAHT